MRPQDVYNFFFMLKIIRLGIEVNRNEQKFIEEMFSFVCLSNYSSAIQLWYYMILGAIFEQLKLLEYTIIEF